MAMMSTLALAGTHTMAAERDVQFTRIIPETQVIELFNSGDSPVPIDGWRFCSHNTLQFFRYTNATAFNGVTIPAKGTITIHLNNDADAGDPTQFNRLSLGSFADFELEAYGLSIYFPGGGGFVSFGDGNLIADHLQWSIDGIDNTVADERSDEAEAGGVWTDQNAWINVQSDTTLIELDDPTYAVLHGPKNYNVVGQSSCPADLTGDGSLNFFDVSAFLTAFGAMDPVADFTGDGSFNFFDVSEFLTAFSAGCP